MWQDGTDPRRDASAPGAVGEVARVFLKPGPLAFGGPAAHIGMMREEVVVRWVRARPAALRGAGWAPVTAGLAGAGPLAGASSGAVGATAAPFTLPGLFGVFLKVVTVLYGSGYVLPSLPRRDLVERLGWLTDRQLLDAIAVGQATPGPVFTTATFVGYLRPVLIAGDRAYR